MERVIALEAACDELEAHLQRASRGAPPPPAPTTTSSSSSSPQEELFEAQLQRDQASAAASRMKQHLLALFGPNAEQLAPPPAKRVSAGKAAGTREADLRATISNLTAALERAMSSSTPSSKYMAEVKERKEVQREAEALRGEVARLKQQLGGSDGALRDARTAAEGSKQQLAAAAREVERLQSLAVQRDHEVRRSEALCTHTRTHRVLRAKHVFITVTTTMKCPARGTCAKVTATTTPRCQTVPLQGSL